MGTTFSGQNGVFLLLVHNVSLRGPFYRIGRFLLRVSAKVTPVERYSHSIVPGGFDV